MRIGEVVIGEEYAYDARWKSIRRRVRAVAIEQVPANPSGRWDARQVRKVLVEVLDWDTGEPKPAGVMSC